MFYNAAKVGSSIEKTRPKTNGYFSYYYFSWRAVQGFYSLLEYSQSGAASGKKLNSRNGSSAAPLNAMKSCSSVISFQPSNQLLSEPGCQHPAVSPGSGEATCCFTWWHVPSVMSSRGQLPSIVSSYDYRAVNKVQVRKTFASICWFHRFAAVCVRLISCLVALTPPPPHTLTQFCLKNCRM